jgi:hypothetical protein
MATTSGLSDAQKAKSLDYLLGRTNLNAGSTITPYIELSSTLPTSAGANITIPTVGQWNNYAREAFANTAAASAGAASNTNTITFPTPTAGTGFTAAYWVMYDAASGGNIISFGSFAVATGVSVGVAFTVAAGGITLTVPTANGVTVYGADYLLDALTGRIAPVLKTTYLALYTTTPSSSGAGTAATNELAYTGGYARVACGTGGGSIFNAATVAATATTTNPSVVNFATLTTGGPTAALTGWGVADTSSGAGNLMIAQAITGGPTVNNNGFPQVPASTTEATLT